MYYGHRSWSEIVDGSWDRPRLTCQRGCGSAWGTIGLYCDVIRSIVIVVLRSLVLQDSKWVIVTSASLVDRLVWAKKVTLAAICLDISGASFGIRIN
jgi:hypothetical protein